MGLTARTAQNFMQAAAQLGAKSEIVSHLPPTTLYKLSSPSLPEPVREEIVERLESGEALSPRQIADRLWEAEKAAKWAAAEAKLTPEERKRQARKKQDANRRRERELEKWRREQDEKREREAKAVKQAAEIIAARLDDESFDAVNRLLYEANPWDIRKALEVAYRGTAEQREARLQVEDMIGSR